MGASKREFTEEREYKQETMNVSMEVDYCYSLPMEIKTEITTNKNKSNMISLSEIKEKLENEEIDPLETYGILKTYEKEFQEVLNLCKEQALRDAENYEKDFELKGYKFEKKNGRAMYNFKGIKAWSELEAKKKEVEARAKNAFNAYKLGSTSISEDGEVNELPIVTYTNDVLSVKKL